jgi:uncharacterized membrane protein
MRRAHIIIFCAPLLFFLFSWSHQKEKVVEEGLSQNKISEIKYPEIVKLHPPTVHFAVALPLFALLFEGFYILRRKSPDVGEFLIIILTSGAVISAAITGYVAHESIENLPIKKEALEVLHTHETLGIYLAGLFSVIALIRLVYFFKSSSLLRTLYLFLLLVGVAGILIQGNHGGSLVYDFGIGVNR